MSEKPDSYRDPLAFTMEAFGRAKTEAEEAGKVQRDKFADLMRLAEAARDDFKFSSDDVVWENDVDAAAWKRYTLPANLRGAGEPPMMDTEVEILRAVQ